MAQSILASPPSRSMMAYFCLGRRATFPCAAASVLKIVFRLEVRDLRPEHLDVVVRLARDVGQPLRLRSEAFPPLVHEAVRGADADDREVDSRVLEYLDGADPVLVVTPERGGLEGPPRSARTFARTGRRSGWRRAPRSPRL